MTAAIIMKQEQYASAHALPAEKYVGTQAITELPVGATTKLMAIVLAVAVPMANLKTIYFILT